MLLSLITLAVEMPEACVPFGAKMVDFTISNLLCNTLILSFINNLSRQGGVHGWPSQSFCLASVFIVRPRGSLAFSDRG